MQFAPTMKVLPGSEWERVWTTSLWSAYFFHWPRQNFFSQYQYNIKQTGDENKKDIYIMGLLFDLTPNTPK